MSVSLMGKVFWTNYPDLAYQDNSGKQVNVSNMAAKVTMLAISDSADDFGENSYNSFETLATKTGMQRRSVMRVVRALINHQYISVTGLSVYGTNDFKISLEKLGELPRKRAMIGRPKNEEIETGDSLSETGDSLSETGDSLSPDPSFNRTHPSHKKGDLIDGMRDLYDTPGAKKATVKEYIASQIRVRMAKNPSGKSAESFINYAADRKIKDQQDIDTFITWWMTTYPMRQYWGGFDRMEQEWPAAFSSPARGSIDVDPDGAPMSY